MKAVTQLTIGTCGGALAAFVWFTANPDLLSAETAGPESEPARVISGTVDEPAPDTEPRVPPAASGELAAGSQAFFDPEAFFALAERAGSIDQLLAGLEVLIATDPARVFAIAARFRGTGSAEIDELYLRAIRGMVDRDPIGAIARLQGLAVGPQRGPMLAAIAEAYAANDADAALRWAVSVMPESPEALGGVLETVAASDLLRAYELMQQVPERIVDASVLGGAMARAALEGGQEPDSIASALAQFGEPKADSILGILLQRWMLQEPESVVAWMSKNEAHLTDELIRSAVYYLAFDEVTLAAELTPHVPASARQQWLGEVANRYGQFDIEAALQWLPQFEGQSGYAEILSRTLNGAIAPPGSSRERTIVAGFIAANGAAVTDDTVVRTGYAYGESDPEAAVRWALSLDDPERVVLAATSVADSWAEHDGAAAQRWMLAQPRGALRDAMLGKVLTYSAFYEGVDPRALLQGFTSPAAAQQSLYQHIIRVAANPGRVTEQSQAGADLDWMLEQLTDPELKRQAEESIAE